ncbi:MrcB family domain-containing protein [Bradyrhizobium sp. SYSU BS000235]|uniref:MrcB family domain-containing protein n=1 Tax=Bradyrhizobium sp. SYSU BS000235 TaxID=3411332 RepID=UPI003C72468B
MTEWARARSQPYAEHPLAAHIRGDAIREMQSAVGRPKGLSFKGSAGSGQWAAVPWLAAFDDIVTESATEGHYVVYLFHTTDPIVHLSLNQGTTGTRAEFKSATHDVLKERAQLMRRRLPDFSARLPVVSIDLGSNVGLPADYAAGHALGVSYSLKTLPSDVELAADLNAVVTAYRALTFRGGLDPIADSTDDEAPEGTASVTERRRYKMHRRIERNPKASKAAKKHHGTKCQGCDLEFHERYGEIGRGFIEAHHLKPIGSLEEGAEVAYDVASDFAVLCANCHRMIHRTVDPSDLSFFRTLLKL